MLMACVSLGGLFLQWPIGYFSDKVDRRYALIGLGVGILVVAAGLVVVNRQTPFVLLAVLFAGFGGLGESLYAVGVAYANDRAVIADYVGLSSTLLFVWALGAAIGPTTGTYAIQLTAPRAFFVYVIALTLAFTLFAIWRLCRRRRGEPADEREVFLAYPQTSPEIYAWLPYHREPPGAAGVAGAAGTGTAAATGIAASTSSAAGTAATGTAPGIGTAAGAAGTGTAAGTDIAAAEGIAAGTAGAPATGSAGKPSTSGSEPPTA
jgi:MFS family permease